MELKVYKTSNEIEDICVTYGLCKLLDMNIINWDLHNKKSYYSIQFNYIDLDGLVYLEIKKEDCYTCNSSMTQKEIESMLENINTYFNTHIVNIFNYYNNQCNTSLNKEITKTQGSLGIGSYFNQKGIRACLSPKSQNVNSYIKFLSFLGWVNATNYIKNDDIEINSIMIPKDTNRILRPFEYSYPDKETNKRKVITFINNKKKDRNDKKSDVIMMAEIYLNTINHFYDYKTDYEKIIFMNLTPAGNKPLPNKCFNLEIYPWSKDLYDKLSKILNHSRVDFDVKDITSKYILQPTWLNYVKLIEIYSKNNQGLDIKFKEDLLKMYDNKVQEVINNQVVKKLGKGLKRLLYDKRGFEILTQLYNTKNVDLLSRRVQEIIDTSARYYNYPVINDDEYKELFNLIKTKNDSKICSSAIISYARVYYTPKSKTEDYDTNDLASEIK